jgi:glycosyltransferase involved in cell wall biosynthesis
LRVALSGMAVKPGATGGGETVLRHLVRHLPGTDEDLELVVFAGPDNQRLYRDLPGVEVHATEVRAESTAMRVAYETVVLPRMLRRHRADVFLGVNHVLPPALPCPGVCLLQNELYYRFREFCRPGLIGWRQSLRLSLRHAYYGSADGRSLRRARHSVAVSEPLRNLASAAAGIPAHRIDVVPLAPSDDLEPRDGDEGRATGPPRLDEPLFVMVGAITPYKNIERAIDAVAKLQERGCAVRVEVVGWDVWGFRRQLEAHAQRARVDDRVVFTGPVDHRETTTYYRRSRSLLLLSSCEAFPLPAVEAMRCGTPVIASNRSGVRGAVGAGGVLLDPDDTDGLAAQMEAVALSDERYMELSRAGREWVKQFSWARTAAGMARALRRATGS